MLQTWSMLCLTLGLALALAPVPHQTMEESLRGALDAISRKQRSLDGNSQDYYNDLRGFKYHGDDGERKLERELDDEMDEEIEFLPSEVGQLETVGNGYQDLNNKLLKRALIAYLKSIPQQDEPVTSLFRERERSSNRKRDSESERLNLDNKQLMKLFMLLKELQNDSPYNVEEGEEMRYVDPLQVLYDAYRDDRVNKLSENTGPMSWGESMIRGQGREADENDYGDREQDPNLLHMSMGDPRNMNGGYGSVGRTQRTYRSMVKRYPIAKRSPKPMPVKKQVTDPKVVQDLGALFGTQTENGQNRTHSHDHDHDHSHDHDHDHDHDHTHDHDHDHDHSHDHGHGDQRKPNTVTEAPNSVTLPPKGQKENTGKSLKSKSIEVRKKSVDWSQYFGIDRRRKKATFTAGQGSQNQDDDWMLQRYYENTVENLKDSDRDYENERKERLDQLDTRPRNIKDLILEEILRYAHSEDGIDTQKVKDKVMSRFDGYSYEKMRKALNKLQNCVAARIEARKMGHAQSNQTSNFRENSNPRNPKDKRVNGGNNLQLPENENAEENEACPELEVIEKGCRRAGKIAGDESEALYLPCVMLQICKACVQDELEQDCLGNYAVEAGKVCDAQVLREGAKGREACVSTAMIISQLQVPSTIVEQCRMDGNDSCLRNQLYRYWHRYLRYPYSGPRPGNYDAIDPQQSDR